MWDFPSLFLYMSVSLIGTLFIWKEKQLEVKRKVSIFNQYYLMFFLLWVGVATFRYVGYQNGIVVGGMDAPMYKEFFEICRSAYQQNLYSYHTESLFQAYTKLIRYFTEDYKVYFAISYGFIVFAYLLFIKEFELVGSRCVAVFMLFFVYLKSFCVFRTHLAIAVILVSLVLIKKNRIFWAVVLALTTPFIQRASIFFAIFPFFYILFKKKKITVKRGMIFVVVGMVIGVVAQRVALTGGYSWMLGGAYIKYAKASMSSGYAIDYVKLIVEQILVLILLLHFDKNINSNIASEQKNGENRLEILRIIMIYDAMLIPISFVLNIWRGVDYFFLPRLIMIDEIISLFEKKVTKPSRKFYYIVIYILIAAWFIFRLSTTYDISAIMPYVFEPFMSIRW